MIVKNDLYDYPHRYIYQDTDGFKFSIDSLLLAEFVKLPKKDGIILDMCTGNAPIPLVLSTKTKNKIYAFEIQKAVYDLAKDSVSLNGLDDQIEIYNNDVLDIDKIFPGKYFDIITCNPPYFVTTSTSQLNKNDYLTIARHEVKIKLDDIFRIVSTHLKENGHFYMVHRPERLDEIILTSEKYKLKMKVFQVITTKNNIPFMILCHFQKHAKHGIRFNPILDISNLKSYQNIFSKEDK